MCTLSSSSRNKSSCNCARGMQGSMYWMKTPAMQTLLHLMLLVVALLGGGHYELAQLQPLSLRLMRGTFVPAIIYAFQILFTFGALLHGSVFILLCTICVAPALIDTTAAVLLYGALPHPSQLPLMVAGACAFLALLFLSEFSWLTMFMLVLWCAAQTAEAAWAWLRTDATAGGRITDAEVVAQIQQAVEEESEAGPAMRLLLKVSGPGRRRLWIGACCKHCTLCAPFWGACWCRAGKSSSSSSRRVASRADGSAAAICALFVAAAAASFQRRCCCCLCRLRCPAARSWC